jgi:hypothetical protein
MITGVGVLVGGTGVFVGTAVGGTNVSVGAEVAGTAVWVGIDVGSARVPLHPAISNATSVKTIACCTEFLTFIPFTPFLFLDNEIRSILAVVSGSVILGHHLLYSFCFLHYLDGLPLEGFNGGMF